MPLDLEEFIITMVTRNIRIDHVIYVPGLAIPSPAAWSSVEAEVRGKMVFVSVSAVLLIGHRYKINEKWRYYLMNDRSKVYQLIPIPSHRHATKALVSSRFLAFITAGSLRFKTFHLSC